MSINRWVGLGRLTKDPELRYTASNIAVCAFTLAVDRRYKQEGQPEADFIQVVAWRHTAEFVSKYITKGTRIAVEGRIQTRTWDDDEGKRHYVTEIVTDQVDFADGKKDGNNNNNSYSSSNSNTNQSEQPSGFIPVESDDDLPF